MGGRSFLPEGPVVAVLHLLAEAVHNLLNLEIGSDRFGVALLSCHDLCPDLGLGLCQLSLSVGYSFTSRVELPLHLCLF